MPEVNIENITKSDSNLAPSSSFVDYHVLPKKIFNEHCLINNNTCIPKKVIYIYIYIIYIYIYIYMYIYISYTVNQWLRYLNTDFALGNCLFGYVELNKNTDLNKCEYSGYGIGFDSGSQLSFTDGSME